MSPRGIPGNRPGRIPGIAAKAKAGCPVSKLMKVEIGFVALSSRKFCAEGLRGLAHRHAARLLLEGMRLGLG